MDTVIQTRRMLQDLRKPLAIKSRGLKIIPTCRNLQIENFAGIQSYRKPNLDRKISIVAGLMAQKKVLGIYCIIRNERC